MSMMMLEKGKVKFCKVPASARGNQRRRSDEYEK
jgi:predicted transcriptional regulator